MAEAVVDDTRTAPVPDRSPSAAISQRGWVRSAVVTAASLKPWPWATAHRTWPSGSSFRRGGYRRSSPSWPIRGGRSLTSHPHRAMPPRPLPEQGRSADCPSRARPFANLGVGNGLSCRAGAALIISPARQAVHPTIASMPRNGRKRRIFMANFCRPAKIQGPVHPGCPPITGYCDADRPTLG